MTGLAAASLPDVSPLSGEAECPGPQGHRSGGHFACAQEWPRGGGGS